MQTSITVTSRAVVDLVRRMRVLRLLNFREILTCHERQDWHSHKRRDDIDECVWQYGSDSQKDDVAQHIRPPLVYFPTKILNL